jgi:hypothetical protein
MLVGSPSNFPLKNNLPLLANNKDNTPNEINPNQNNHKHDAGET